MFGNLITRLSKELFHPLVVGFHDLEACSQGGLTTQPADQGNGSLCV